MEFKTYLLPIWLCVLLLAEYIIPCYDFGTGKLRHGAVNISAGMLSFFLNGVLLLPLALYVLKIESCFSALLPHGVKLVILFILFDLWMYWWHRINHEVPFFWRFHKAHHADIAMDVTTALRFHPAELFLSTLLRLPVYFILGVGIDIMAVYEAAVIVVILFHHSNIKLHERIDKLIGLLIPTPAMHKVHHSDFYRETNSNYGTVLSVWDRIFGTYNPRMDSEKIRIGLNSYRDKESQSFIGFLKIPFRSS